MLKELLKKGWRLVIAKIKAVIDTNVLVGACCKNQHHKNALMPSANWRTA